MAGGATIVTCPNCNSRNRIRAGQLGVPRCGVCHTALPWLVEADARSFDGEIVSSLPVLVDLWAPWCGPCKMVSPVVEKAGREHAGRLKVVKLNVDEAPQVAGRYEVRGIPLLLLLKDGAEVDRLLGAVPPARLEAWLAPNLPAREHSAAGAGAD